MLFPTEPSFQHPDSAVRFEKEKSVQVLFDVYFASADLPLTHHKPPFSPYFAVTPHLPHRHIFMFFGVFGTTIPVFNNLLQILRVDATFKVQVC
jgi:hypothetical protein